MNREKIMLGQYYTTAETLRLGPYSTWINIPCNQTIRLILSGVTIEHSATSWKLLTSDDGAQTFPRGGSPKYIAVSREIVNVHVFVHTEMGYSHDRLMCTVSVKDTRFRSCLCFCHQEKCEMGKFWNRD